jgi:hypothetical protein
MAPSKETSIEANIPVGVHSPVRRIASGVAARAAFSSPTKRTQAIRVFYTPTKTRSVPIDPTLLAEAEIHDSIQNEPSLTFLSSSSPLQSSSSLPEFHLSPVTAPKQGNLADPDPLLLEEPETEQSAALHALHQSQEQSWQMIEELTVQRVQLVLMAVHIDKLKKALYHREERAKKKGGKLLGDGLPRVLTSDEFVRLVKEHHSAAEAAVADSSRRKEERAAVAQLKAVWELEQSKINQANAEIKATYEAELNKWQAEVQLAKEENHRPRWTRPKKWPRIPSLPKTWIKRRQTAKSRTLADAVDSHSEESSDDNGTND